MVCWSGASFVTRRVRTPFSLDAVAAPAGSGGAGYFAMTPELTARLRSEAAVRFPSCDVVGWWHTHTSVSNFSGTDRRTQRLWDDPRHVGLLVFASGAKQAQAYLGPDAELLVSRALDAKPAASRPVVHQWPAEPVPRAEPKRPPTRRTDTAWSCRPGCSCFSGSWH